MRQHKGLEENADRTYTFAEFQEEQFDRLAAVVRGSLDVEFLMEIIRA